MSEAYAGQNDQANALKALEKVIALDAQNVEAYARLADIYSKSGQQDKAKATYEKMMGLRPNDPSVYLILGNYNRNAQKYAEALPLYLKSNMLAKSADALDGMAVCAAALDKWSEAMDAAESAVAADATKFSSRLVLAEALIRAKNYTAAKQHVDMVVAAKPGVAKYLGWQALCYDAAGDKDGLAKIDKQIVSLDKQDAASRLRLAKYDLDKGDKDGATVLLKELVTLTPKDPFVFKSLYQISKDKADKAGAISYLATYLILSPSDAEAHKNQGDQFYEKKDLDGALTEYRTALKIDPTVKGFYGRYAEIVIAKGQTEEAIKALNGVIASGDANAGTYQTLGSIYEKGKTYPKAIAMFQKALTLEPSNTSLLCALGDCQAESGDLMNAVSSYEQAVMMNTKAVTEYKTLGDLYTKQAKADQAFKAYAKYLDGNPADEAVAKKLADICYGKKDWAGTVKYLALAKSTAGTEGQLLMLGTAQFNLQKWADASTAFSKWFDESGKKASPKDKASVLLMAGTSYETQNLPDKAIEVYDEYCKLPGMRNADAAFKRALLREKNDTKLAVTIYTQNQKEYPQDTRNYLQLGLIYSKDQATLPKSAAMLEKAVANVGKDKTVWLSIAQVYGKLNQPAKELDAYKKYIEADPQNVQANVRIGSILMTNNKTSEAMVYLETANTLSPNNPDVMIKLAEGYVKTNRPKDALALLQKAKAVRKDDVDLRSNLFLSYAKLGMDKEAMQEVKELVDMTHDNKYRLEYARYLFTSGKHKDASEQIEDIKATNPEDLDALMLSADIRRADKQLDSAVQVYKEIGFINPDYAPALCGRADCHLEQNKPLWANDFYQKALRADPKCYKAYLGLARLAKVRKDNAGYADNVKKAFAIAPDDPDVKAEYAKISK